jgi:hypothetical protein
MNLLPEINDRFEAVLRDEALADRTMYDASGFFDELPLYSRYRQISFLSRFGNVDDLLIQLSLNYLESIVNSKRSTAECFAAITLLDYADAEFLVPNIFVCNGWVSRRLRTLRLTPPASTFATSLRRRLDNLKLSTTLAAAQDTLSSPGNVRVFLGYRKAPNEHVVALPTLAKTLVTATGAAS